MTRDLSAREWQPRGRDFDTEQYREALLAIFAAVRDAPAWDQHALMRILARHPRDSKGYFSKIELVSAYQQLTAAGTLPFERTLQRRLQMKPIRTSSGVAPVTVLTEPAGCPGHCIFCPDAEGMPKSYLPDEPGARRAAQCGFDPYLQVRTRLDTFEAMGHATDKVELLILGGTWSAYSRKYRGWFVRRCLDAMNEANTSSGRSPTEPVDRHPERSKAEPKDTHSEAESLAKAQARNETASHRNVGLVIETRPDWVTPDEIVHLRRLGVTKVQLGVQSLDDRILALNRPRPRRGGRATRGGVAARRRLQAAFALDAQPARRDAGIGSGRLRPALVGRGAASRRAEDLPLLDHRGHRALPALA